MSARVCTRCGASKPLPSFSPDKRRASGVQACCKTCQAAAMKAKRHLDLDATNAKTRAYQKANAPKMKAARRAQRLLDRDRQNERQRVWREANRDKSRAASSAWAKANPETVAATAAAWRVANAEKITTNQKNAYRTGGTRTRRLADNSAYRARRLNACPLWLTKEHKRQIAAFYEAADVLGMLTGEWYEVDHIVPLQGKTVCGLHVPWNLQVLTATKNASKNNRYWPGKP